MGRRTDYQMEGHRDRNKQTNGKTVYTHKHIYRQIERNKIHIYRQIERKKIHI
jgi:hypothetical protein